MEFTQKRNVQIIGGLLILAALTQAIYTFLYVQELDVPRQLLWGTEGVIFTILAAFAGSALVASARYRLGFAAITAAAILNVVQVGVGLTMFGPFFEVAGEVPAFEPAAAAVVAFSFMVYNAAKMLLGLAALVFGRAMMAGGSKALGRLTLLVGGVALVANGISLAAGRDVFGELPLAGGTGVLATVLLALCLFGSAKDD